MSLSRETNSRSAEYAADRAAAVHLAAAGEAFARSILWTASDPTAPDAIVSGTVAQEGGTITYSGTYDGATHWNDEVEVNGSGFNMQATGSAGYVGDGGIFSLENVSGSYKVG